MEHGAVTLGSTGEAAAVLHGVEREPLVMKQRAMGFTAGSLTEQGTVTPGTMTRQQVYNFPPAHDPTLADAPAYTTMTETWDSMDVPPAVTQYNVQQKTSPRRLEVIQPDGTHHIQLSYNPPSNQQWKTGWSSRTRSETPQGHFCNRLR